MTWYQKAAAFLSIRDRETKAWEQGWTACRLLVQEDIQKMKLELHRLHSEKEYYRSICVEVLAMKSKKAEQVTRVH